MLFGIRMIPYGSRYMAEAVVALRRIQEMLLVCIFLLSLKNKLSTTNGTHSSRLQQTLTT